MIELREIDWSNLGEILDLKVEKSQEDFILPNEVFIAQAYVNLRMHYPDVVFGIYNDHVAIGFTKIVLVPKNEKPYYFDHTCYMIDAFMLDSRFQKKGLGRQAFEKIMLYILSQPFGFADGIRLLCSVTNRNGQHFFKSFGFEDCGHYVSNLKNYIMFSYSIPKK